MARKRITYGNNSINLRVHRHFSGGARSKIESMTARDKAKELVSEFYNVFVNDEEEHYIGTAKRIAKQCALIAVDLVIDNIEDDYMRKDLKYWQDVKTEIEKL